MTSFSDQKTQSSLKDPINNAAEDNSKSSTETVKNAQKSSKSMNTSNNSLKDETLEMDRKVSPAIDDIAAKAQALAERSINFCADSSERARRQIHQASEATTRYVIEQPGRSVLLAAAAGAAIAAVLLSGTRRR